MARQEPSGKIETVDIEPKPQTSFLGKLRAYFFTGLVITAPTAITIWATYWFVTFFDAWVKPLIPAAYNPDTYLPFALPGYGLIFALFAITVIGALARPFDQADMAERGALLGEDRLEDLLRALVDRAHDGC